MAKGGARRMLTIIGASSGLGYALAEHVLKATSCPSGADCGVDGGAGGILSEHGLGRNT